MNKKEIEEQIHEFAEKMYQAGYADGNNTNLIDEAYQEGLNDAWECVKEIIYFTGDGGLSDDELCEIFGTAFLRHILRDYLPSEAIQKIKDYEERKKQKDAEICVGDEVYAFQDSEIKRIAIYINDTGDVADTVLPSGMIMPCLIKDLTKTGKHYSQIAEVLKELRGDYEE